MDSDDECDDVEDDVEDEDEAEDAELDDYMDPEDWRLVSQYQTERRNMMFQTSNLLLFMTHVMNSNTFIINYQGRQ